MRHAIEAEVDKLGRALRYVAPAWAVGGWVVAACGNWQAFQPWGSRGLYVIGDMLFMAQLLAVLACVSLLLHGLNRRRLADCIVGIVALALWWAGLAGFRTIHREIRHAAVPAVEAQARPVVHAIDAFTRARGRPPLALNELVPAYLVSNPSTGLGAFPEFQYRPRDPVATLPAARDAAERAPEEIDPWTLQVYTSFGMNFDTMVYTPSGRYPEVGWGGAVVRIGAWAYVWE